MTTIAPPPQTAAAQGWKAGGISPSIGNLPLCVEELTTLWLNQAFLITGKAPTVVRSQIDRIIWGTATKVLMRIDCQDDLGAAVTKHICIKGPFDERLRTDYNLGTIFVSEAAFYRDVAPQLSIMLPECLYAEEDGEQGVLILEDLTVRGATFGDPSRALTPEQVLPILEVLAGLHSATWGWKPDAFPWLQLGSGSIRTGIPALMAGDRFDVLGSRREVSSFRTAPYTDKERILSALSSLWERDDASPNIVLCHGDAHAGQLYFEPDGRAGLLDWQSIGLMPWAKDVAYFMGSALSVVDRRYYERDLLASYLQALERKGGPQIGLADAWDEYRAQMLQGLVWMVVTEQMQPIDVIAALNERYLSAVSDLDSLGVLGF